jgi:hypothetical protein
MKFGNTNKESPISAYMRNRSFPIELPTTTLNYTSKLLPCSYIAEQVIWNVLLYKSGRSSKIILAAPLE